MTFGGSSTDGDAGIVVKEWQRLPKQLLQQYCDRIKYGRPHYHAGQRGGAHNCAVRLVDPKDASKSSRHELPGMAAATAQDAQHRAALFALHEVDPTVQHHLKLPEPYRALWLEWQRSPPVVARAQRTTLRGIRANAALPTAAVARVRLPKLWSRLAACLPPPAVV